VYRTYLHNIDTVGTAMKLRHLGGGGGWFWGKPSHTHTEIQGCRSGPFSAESGSRKSEFKKPDPDPTCTYRYGTYLPRINLNIGPLLTTHYFIYPFSRLGERPFGGGEGAGTGEVNGRGPLGPRGPRPRGRPPEEDPSGWRRRKESDFFPLF